MCRLTKISQASVQYPPRSPKAMRVSVVRVIRTPMPRLLSSSRSKRPTWSVTSFSRTPRGKKVPGLPGSTPPCPGSTVTTCPGRSPFESRAPTPAVRPASVVVRRTEEETERLAGHHHLGPPGVHVELAAERREQRRGGEHRRTRGVDPEQHPGLTALGGHDHLSRQSIG